MIYKDFHGMKLSALGMGGMRFPTLGEGSGNIDVSSLREMIKYAIDRGVNYFDTAWRYHDGMSETVLGELLSEYPRESYYLATKFPGYDLSVMTKVKEIFAEQIRKCGVRYFDFYLFHNVCERNIDAYLDPKLGILEHLLKQKKAGRIRHLGFSAHGRLDTVKRFLDAYGEHLEFCQIQLNWLDYTLQNAKEKVALLKEYGIPVWVMEPLRGGALTKLSVEHESILKSLRPEATAAEWGFRFLQSIPEVTVILSGMSDLNQIKENVKTFEGELPLNDAEMSAILGIAEDMTRATSLPCTACRYCTDHCPKGINIPEIISLYNEYSYVKGGFLVPMAVNAIPEDKRPSACIGCKACEAVCPQSIKISDMMKSFTEKLGNKQ